MSGTGRRRARPDYGVDAPGVVRNLLLVGAAGLAVALAGALTGRPLEIKLSIAGVRLVFPLARMAPWIGIGFTSMGLWMLWSSKVGKLQDRERLLDRIAWSGEERVLDVGCGRGLMLVGAAKRLKGGRATGIDVWQAEDLSGNRPEATLENARLEGVARQAEVKTADMRAMPFPAASFNVVVSCSAIHNLYDPRDRAKAIGEIARVLKPGGRALIDDIRHGREYAAALAANGCVEVCRVSSPLAGALLTLVTLGSLRPVTLVATRSGGV